MMGSSASKFSILLIVSVIVNALLIGFIIGGGVGKRHSPDRFSGEANGPRTEALLVRSLQQSVPQGERPALRRALRQAFEETRTERRALREQRRDLAQLLVAENYDQQAVEEAFERIRAAEAITKARLHQELTLQWSKLSFEQRQSAIDTMAKRGRHNGGEQGAVHPPGPPPR